MASLNLRTLLKFKRIFPDMTVNILLSFAMLTNEVSQFLSDYREIIGHIIMDSGTWSLNNAKTPNTKWVNLKNYINYLKQFGHLFDYYFNFDSDFSAKGREKNQYNQQVMEDAGLTPVPVVHDIYGSEIKQYINAGYRRVALGSSQIRTQDNMAQVCGLFYGTGIKLHVLGKSTWDLLAYFDISDTDSAMWAREGGWGYIRWWNPNLKGVDKTDRLYLEEYIRSWGNNAHEYSSYKYKDEFDAYLLNTFGLKYYDLFGDGNHVNKMMVNTYYFVQMEERINKMHKKLGFRK